MQPNLSTALRSVNPQEHRTFIVSESRIGAEPIPERLRVDAADDRHPVRGTASAATRARADRRRQLAPIVLEALLQLGPRYQIQDADRHCVRLAPIVHLKHLTRRVNSVLATRLNQQHPISSRTVGMILRDELGLRTKASTSGPDDLRGTHIALWNARKIRAAMQLLAVQGNASKVGARSIFLRVIILQALTSSPPIWQWHRGREIRVVFLHDLATKVNQVLAAQTPGIGAPVTSRAVGIVVQEVFRLRVDRSTAGAPGQRGTHFLHWNRRAIEGLLARYSSRTAWLREPLQDLHLHPAYWSEE